MYGIDESFSYTTLFLLKINVLFGNRRNLTLIEALEGRRVLEMSIREDGMYFCVINEQEEFMNFLDECSDLVYYKNGFIYLRDEVTQYNIDEMIAKIKPSRYLDYSVSIFKYLKITKPIELIYKYYDFEKNIEKIYMSNNKENNESLDKLLEKRDEIIKEIATSDEDYQDMIIELQDELYEELSDKYVLFPINVSKYEQSEHYDEQTDLVELLSSPVQRAIFTDFPLYRTKVKYSLDSIVDNNSEAEINNISQENMDATEEFYDATMDYDYPDDVYDSNNHPEEEYVEYLDVSLNLTKEDMIFSIMYIKELETIKDKYKNVSEHIDNIIMRLKYLNDNSDLKLYDKKRFKLDEVIDNISCKNADYIYYADEVMYFISEILNTYYDRYFLEKLMFIKTYYDLTKDMEIINYMNSFSDSILYRSVYKIITGEEPNKKKIKKF